MQSTSVEVILEPNIPSSVLYVVCVDILGDEYHTFFECTKPEIVSLRKHFIPLHYSQQPSMFKFVKLLRSVDDIKVGNRISLFIRHSKIV